MRVCTCVGVPAAVLLSAASAAQLPAWPRGGGRPDGAFSPKGDWIAYTSRCSLVTCRLSVVRADGTRRRVLTRAVGTWSWSPDGRRLAFHVPEGVTGDGAAFVAAPAGRPKLVARGVRSGFLWSPTGRELAVA